ncbi:MAG: hypothetical protein RIR70_2163 [Pseudomonadota bacterium]|jgi:hypothetical protein
MRRPRLPIVAAVALAPLVFSSTSLAQSSDWQVGAVLDAGHTTKNLELGARDKGLELGHSDLLIRGPLGKHFSAEASLAVHTADGRLEHHTESLWVQTRTLPAGLQARAGRFSSQIGYLNEQHPHADDFTERPLLYRGLLGGHWFDDGLRLNWTAPTPIFLRVGVEAFSGKQLVKEAQRQQSPGARTVSIKTGADLNERHSWQAGLSYLNNRREAPVPEHEEAEGEHDHAHGAAFTGKHLRMADLVYKWAPDGNMKNQQVRLIWEHARFSGIHPEAGSRRHQGSALSAIWRFHPAWEIGARTDRLSVNRPELHDEGAGPELEFAAAKLREHALMLAYKPNHMQTWRVQLSRQKAFGDAATEVFPQPAHTSLQFQLVIGFGAHGAHSF